MIEPNEVPPVIKKRVEVYTLSTTASSIEISPFFVSLNIISTLSPIFKKCSVNVSKVVCPESFDVVEHQCMKGYYKTKY